MVLANAVKVCDWNKSRPLKTGHCPLLKAGVQF